MPVDRLTGNSQLNKDCWLTCVGEITKYTITVLINEPSVRTVWVQRPYPKDSLEHIIIITDHLYSNQVYVLKRPHVDEFLQRVGELFECVLFTASLAKVRPWCRDVDRKPGEITWFSS